MASKASFSLRLFELIFGLAASQLKGRKFPQAQRQLENRKYPSPALPPAYLRKRVHVQEQTIHGQAVYILSPRQDGKPIHVIYLHGGAYVYPLSFTHWLVIQEILKHTGASFTVPTYPLAPEHTYHETFPLLDEVYRQILQEHPDDQIVLCGDSAGAGLALAAVMDWRDRGLPLPHNLVLFSPWLDITMSNPQAAQAETQDGMLGIPGLVQCGEWWAGEDDPHSPKLSPIFGDLAGLPPIAVFIGTHDLFYPDVQMLAQKVEQSGGEIHLQVAPGGMHDYVMATFTPEAQAAYRYLAGVVGSRAAQGKGWI
jgi:monoterpene epsilon-lactone hydrolase